jgi:hypothetical protein
MHQEIAALGGADQAADCGLPFLEILLGFRQLRDVTGRLLEGSELAAIGEDRILEGPGPIESTLSGLTGISSGTGLSDALMTRKPLRGPSSFSMAIRLSFGAVNALSLAWIESRTALRIRYPAESSIAALDGARRTARRRPRPQCKPHRPGHRLSKRVRGRRANHPMGWVGQQCGATADRGC